jgi:hypothetical protein
MVVEIYTYQNNTRLTDFREYTDYTQFEKDLMIMKFQDIWCGHKIYDIEYEEFFKLTDTQRNNYPCKAVFDRDAFIRKH